MSQRIHLAWASVSLAMVGIGFGLGSLEDKSAQAASAPPPGPKSSPLLRPLPVAPVAAEVASSALLAAPRSRAPTPQRQPGTRAQALQPNAVPAAPSVAARQPAPAPFALGPAPLLLDADAEALVRILLRLRLNSEEESTPQDASEAQREFVSQVVQNMAYSLHEDQHARICVALAALLPEGEYWQSYGSPLPPGLVQARRLAYEQRPTPESLERLVSLLEKGDAEGLDARWIEQLMRANPGHASLQTLFAEVAPDRAASVFAEGGLTRRERELLIDVVGRKDSGAAARLARELLLETFDVDHLVSALDYDPAGTNTFLQQRQGDPVWAELGAMARLQRAYSAADNQGQIMVAAASYWRQLSTQRLPSVLEMMNDESWTPLENEILEAIMASGDEELISDLKYLAPPEVQWKLRAREDRLEDHDSGDNLEVERFLEFLEEQPFRARATLEDFYRVLPHPSSRGAFHLAAGFQDKGDVETATAILQRAQEGELVQAALAQLAAGLSLSDLDEDEIEPEEDE